MLGAADKWLMRIMKSTEKLPFNLLLSNVLGLLKHYSSGKRINSN